MRGNEDKVTSKAATCCLTNNSRQWGGLGGCDVTRAISGDLRSAVLSVISWFVEFVY